MRTGDMMAEDVDRAQSILRGTVAMWRSCGMKPDRAVKQTREQMWDFYFGRPS